MKKILLVLAMGSFLFSCGGPSTCDCVNKSAKEQKEEGIKEACDEMEDEYKKMSKEDKKAMKEEIKACKEEK
tara:strand:+ start:672 stop:887 length:216 start_codon:yes stop_codon:yes gene_type:complete